MNRKKVLVAFIACSILIGIMLITAIKPTIKVNENIVLGEATAEKAENKLSTFVTEKIKKTAEEAQVATELNEEVSMKGLIDSTENIAIIRIISLDSSSAQFDQVVGKTYGKMLINTVIKGNLKEGEVVDYAALGGYLTIAEWEQYQPAAANEKRDFLREQSGIKLNKEESYIHLQFEDNIDVEEGKTYIAYMNYNSEMGKYEITGFADGLMELSIEKEQKRVSPINIDSQKVMIKNNHTGEYESLESYTEKVKSNM